MDPTEITVQTLTSAYPLTADGADVPTFEAMDVANGNTYRSTGREVLLVHNTSVDTAYDFTIRGEPDELGRDADTVHEIAFGDIAMYFLATKGFRKANRYVDLAAENAALEIAVVRLPS